MQKTHTVALPPVTQRETFIRIGHQRAAVSEFGRAGERSEQQMLLTRNTTQSDMPFNSSSSPSTSVHCHTTVGLHISAAFIVTKNFLLVPLSTLVLYLGVQRWRQQQRSFASTSHSDVFTYHLCVMELILALGNTLYFCGGYSGHSGVLAVGIYLSYMEFPSHVSFHMLTCVERYLAVAHPVTYMGLKQTGGVKIRNISTVCVWLLCFGWSAAMYNLYHPVEVYLCSLVFSLIVVSFCSLRVLCVLIRPGPGEVGGDRERVDQSKQRAFHTVMAIMGVLWLWFAGVIVSIALEDSHTLSPDVGCAVLIAANWFTLPSSLVLPLLFLHRAGKLHCCR